MESPVGPPPQTVDQPPEPSSRVAALHRELMDIEDPALRGRIHLELGRLSLKEGRLESAVRHFREALLLDPRLEPARSLLHELGEGSRFQEGRTRQRRSAVKALLGRLRR